MDTQVSFANVATFQPHATLGHVLCCLCGTSIPPNPSNMCINCIRSQVDISEGLQKQVTVLWCKGCGRYLQPPKHWVRAELESKELLTFCIKKIKGLSKVKLIDAGFIWTEPHSKRLKVKMTVQAEVFNGTILQQSFVVDYVIENNMCADCNRRNANPNSWNACVQLRQHVYHKRTFLYLEQLILKHNAASNCIKITDIHEGVDFFYGQRGHALKFIDFLQAVVPLRYRHDKQLVSHDTHNNTYNYKYTFSVEIAPLCKDDLVVLPHKLASGLGNLGPITIVLRVSSHVTLIDPVTLRIHSMDAQVYWRQPFMAAMSMKQLVEYVVLDVEPIDPQGQRGGGGGQHSASSSNSYSAAGQGAYGGSGQQGQQGQPGSSGRYLLADVQVARVSDFGRNDTVFFARTHLGHLLHPGDRALGYDLSTAQLVTLDFEAHVNRGGRVPDVILVRKSFEEKRRRRRERGQQRLWKLKRLDMEVEDEASAVGGAAGAGPKRGRGGRAAQQSANDEEAERERFMQEIEEDPELRSRINVYKDKDAIAAAQAQQPQAGAVPAPAGLHSDGMSDDDDEGDLPEVPLEELLDDLEGLNIDGEDDEDDDEADDEDMEDA